MTVIRSGRISRGEVTADRERPGLSTVLNNTIRYEVAHIMR